MLVLCQKLHIFVHMTDKIFPVTVLLTVEVLEMPLLLVAMTEPLLQLTILRLNRRVQST